MTEREAATISVGTVQDAARVLKCIGHPVRLRIIELLDNGGERTVTEIREAIGLEQAAASQHLNLMRDKRILAARRDGVNVYYDISDEKVVRVIDCLRACDITNR
ncbi:MAG: metalloregulator ArsR/SmtB family transcription factor [Gemmatimonadetes bacterium]|nr:metalloregulator ArsR/SmtB family transcription factor [Gemmatimonadota bacterium]MBT8479028.1 metalloregulator ArsR/SmtB family transcription factor [Gemmatimonadota bacterium]